PSVNNHQLMLDRTISPLMQSNQVMTGFRAAAWSPGGADALGRCIIASLSCDHRLCIHELQRNGQAWIKVVELSELFYEHVKEESFRLAKERIDQVTGEHSGLMEKLKWQTYCLAAVALWWDQTKLFVSLTNGQVCCVNVGQDSSLTVDVVDIQRESTDNMKHVDVPSWQVHGVCGTPGGVYLCLLESPAGDYCHLTILEPLKLTLVLRADTDVASVVLKQDESLCGCIDALAQVKFILAQKQPLPESLAQLVKDKSAWPNLPIGRQKLLRFLLQAMKLANVESQVTSEDVLEADKLIMKSHLETALTRLLKMEIKPTTDAEKKSLMLVCDWLSSCHGNSKSHDQHLTQKVIGMLEHIQPGMDTREKCEICEANISFTSYRKDQCPNGHVFARCCQTLLICHSVPYRTCVSCEALAIGQHISGSSWFEDLKTNTCTFCDGLLL
ncbi:hypothetical protein LSAT2_032155, partial [Lamellibrachia satsuma]